MSTTFGIEEEFMLISPQTLAPVDLAPAAIATLQKKLPHSSVSAEFHQSQVEHATAVCTEPVNALADLREFRSALAEWADEHDVIPLATGTSPRRPERPVDIHGDRYQRIAHDVGLPMAYRPCTRTFKNTKRCDCGYKILGQRVSIAK